MAENKLSINMAEYKFCINIAKNKLNYLMSWNKEICPFLMIVVKYVFFIAVHESILLPILNLNFN